MKYLTIHHFFLIGIVLMFLWVGYTSWLTYEPFTAPILKTDPMPILNPNNQVKSGDLLHYKVDFCSFKKVPTTNSRIIEEVGGAHREFFLATTLSEGREPGCYNLEASFPLAMDIQPGKYRVKSTGTYKVNTLKEVTKVFYTEEFEIID